MKLKVTGVRYWETRNGVGYQATTNVDGDIWNDGDGGGTYFIGKTREANAIGRAFDEFELDELIDVYEAKALF